MKPCRDEDRIRRLISVHENQQIVLKSMVDYHQVRINMLTDYVSEIRKPGFKFKNQSIIMSEKPKPDHIVIASNTYTGESYL